MREHSTQPGQEKVTGTPGSYLRAVRPLHWVKNLLLFAPLLLAHEFFNFQLYLKIFAAFAALSLCASAGYVINDILDVESDRRHTVKRNRPVASGEIKIPAAWALAASLTAAAFTIAFFLLGFDFSRALLLYLAFSMLYSLWAKRVPLLDVLALSGLYAFRIFMGGVAASVPISQWLLAFSSFFFLGIAFVKRYVELRDHKSAPLPGRNYRPEDIQVVRISGISSAYMSVVIFFLYIANSHEAVSLYRNPAWLWGIGPLLIYWNTRLWMLGEHGRIDSDPLVFVVKDPPSWVIGICIAACAFLAMAL
jgi:4-hydroxybenzoate polyprenyltransferase